MNLAYIDQSAVQYFNNIIMEHPFIAKVAQRGSSVPLLRGLPIVFSFYYIWFRNNMQRPKILAGLVAATLATMIAVALQFLVHVHGRPFLRPELHLFVADDDMLKGWDRLNSFPSDTATLYFAVCFIILSVSPGIGLLCFLWTGFTAGIARVMLGYHYPSDIAGSLVLSGVMVFIFLSRPSVSVFELVLDQTERYKYALNAFFCCAVAEIYVAFSGLEVLFRGALDVLKRKY